MKCKSWIPTLKALDEKVQASQAAAAAEASLTETNK